MKKQSGILCLMFFILGAAAMGFTKEGLSGQAAQLLEQAKQTNPRQYQFAKSIGASIEPTSDGKSFFVSWAPDKNPKGWIVTLHGHDGWAFCGMDRWQEALKKYHLGLLAIQWWFGSGEAMNDYYTPPNLYREITTWLSNKNVTPGSVLLHGFSRGSANTYALAQLDVASGNHFFGLFIANAGGFAEDFPFNRPLLDGSMGPEPLKGTKWITFAGGQDPQPDRSGIPGMRRTSDLLSKLGADVLLSIEDEKADHGGFHKNPENMHRALRVYESLLGP